MGKIKLNIEELKKDEELLTLLNAKTFATLKYSNIIIDDDGISTNAGTKDDSTIKYRDSIIIGALVLNILLMIADKWDSIDDECREFINANLEMITNYMEENNGKDFNEKII